MPLQDAWNTCRYWWYSCFGEARLLWRLGRSRSGSWAAGGIYSTADSTSTRKRPFKLLAQAVVAGTRSHQCQMVFKFVQVLSGAYEYEEPTVGKFSMMNHRIREFQDVYIGAQCSQVFSYITGVHTIRILMYEGGKIPPAGEARAGTRLARRVVAISICKAFRASWTRGNPRIDHRMHFSCTHTTFIVCFAL